MLFACLCIYYFIMGVVELFEIPISKKILAFFALFPAFFLTAFRDVSVGCDTITYSISFIKVGFFDSLFDAIKYERYENGYVFLEYMFSHLNFSFFQMQFVISLLFYVSFYFFLVRYSKNIGISCVLFLTLRYMLAAMVVTRMYLALAVLYLSIPFVLKRNYWAFSLLVLFASTFHKTAFIFIFLYPLALTSLSLKKSFLFISVAGILGFIGKNLFVFLSLTLGLYESYLGGQYFNVSGNIAVYLIFVIDVCLALFILYNKEKSKLLVQDSQRDISVEKICYSSILFIICCDIIGFNFALMSRISDFFSFSWLILIPMTFMKMKNKIAAVICLIVITICLFIQFETVMTLRPNWNCVEPYQFYFGEIF